MKRQKLVVGNWKMNGTRASVSQLLMMLRDNLKPASAAKMVVLPSFVHLEQTEQLLSGSAIEWGAQDLNTQPGGAFTGEVSAAMVLEFGCRYVLVGHSERRSYQKESDELVAEKFQVALRNRLIPIFCVGETLRERQSDQTFKVIKRQLQAALKQSKMKDAVIAYEPVWAIGTGQTATGQQAEEVHQFIRQTIAEEICILYGGSITANNAKELFAMPNIDGGLVGGASLKAESFLEIYNSV